MWVFGASVSEVVLSENTETSNVSFVNFINGVYYISESCTVYGSAKCIAFAPNITVCFKNFHCWVILEDCEIDNQGLSAAKLSSVTIYGELIIYCFFYKAFECNVVDKKTLTVNGIAIGVDNVIKCADQTAVTCFFSDPILSIEVKDFVNFVKNFTTSKSMQHYIIYNFIFKKNNKLFRDTHNALYFGIIKDVRAAKNSCIQDIYQKRYSECKINECVPIEKATLDQYLKEVEKYNIPANIQECFCTALFLAKHGSKDVLFDKEYIEFCETAGIKEITTVDIFDELDKTIQQTALPEDELNKTNPKVNIKSSSSGGGSSSVPSDSASSKKASMFSFIINPIKSMVSKITNIFKSIFKLIFRR